MTELETINAKVCETSAFIPTLKAEIAKVIVGQEEVVEQILIAMLCRGHCLLVGVPGLAKTLLVSTVAQLLHLSFRRIQFTPDLMPSDITGTDILQDDPETGKKIFQFMHKALAHTLKFLIPGIMS